MTRLYLLIFLFLFCTDFYAQETVFPGDANANRIIDQYDLLSIGYAFGTTGPARIQMEDVSIQGIPLTWDENFPGGNNFIHTDCDGNGIVNYLDIITLTNNFGLPLDNPSPLSIDQGIGGVDPNVVWNNNDLEVVVSSGAVLNIPIAIPLNDLQDVNGLAFNLHYDRDYFQLALFSTEDNWLEIDNHAISLIKIEEDNDNRGLMQVAITRFGADPVTGGGTVGTLKLIIIDDMICFLEAPEDTLKSKIYLEGILMVDGDFNRIPVAADTFCLNLFHDLTSTLKPQNTNQLQARIFPNPSTNILQLKSNQDFKKIELIDGVGRSRIIYNGIPRKQWEANNLQLIPGIYTVRLSGEQGNSVLKYMVVNNKL